MRRTVLSRARCGALHPIAADMQADFTRARPKCLSFPYDGMRVWWDLIVLLMLIYVGLSLPL